MDSGYLSDDSDFYGDTPTKSALSERVKHFDVLTWFVNKLPSPTELADAGVHARQNAKIPAKKPVTLYNPYEGDEYSACARQLSESLDRFLERLPPATTKSSESVEWIYLSNPYWEASATSGGEGPEGEGGRLAEFIETGMGYLDELRGLRQGLEDTMKGKAKGTITKEYNKRGWVEGARERILEAATRLRCTSGKWMLFVEPVEVDEVWGVVAKAVAKNQLGTAAKVGPDDGKGGHRLLCVYTHDFNDMLDITRVAQKMQELGLISSRGQGIYYKCDAYTHLHLNSNNQYGIKTTLYSSKDILAAGGDQKKLARLSCKRRKTSETGGKLRIDISFASLPSS